MALSTIEFLRHIRDEISYLQKSSRGIHKADFVADPTLQRAFVRSIEVIGEAVKKLPESLREQHTNVDWRALAGMRDRLIHAYFSIDYDIVWDVVSNKIPELATTIEKMLKQQLDA
jgi:uncharacterized protein with HEPN domain